MALTDKSPSEFYKDLLHMDNSNSGIGTSVNAVKDGLGNLSSMYVSDDHLVIQPENDNSTATFSVKNQAGTQLFNVDTTNSVAKALGEYLNTQFHTWSIVGETPVATTHHPIPCQGLGGGEFTNPAGFGTGTDPATALTISSAASSYSSCFFYVPNNIVIDEVRIVSSAAAASTHTYHIYSYAMVTGSGSTAGNLTDGTLIAHNGSPLTVGADRVSSEALTIDSASVVASRVLVAFYEAQDTDAATIQMIMRYHLV